MTLIEHLRTLRTPLTIAETAALLGLHPQTVYRWVWAAKIPYMKIGRTVKFDPASLAEWVSRRSMA